jgi:DNA/RNA endonuclease YhcR with UshA esterase domain
LALVMLVRPVPLRGHHSFAASYLEDQVVSIEGEVVELEYRNPHSWVQIQARDNFGQMQKVSAEWASPVRLNQQGIGKDALKPGDRVIITGSPSRNPADYSMHLKKIVRPADGWQWAGRGERR